MISRRKKVIMIAGSIAFGFLVPIMIVLTWESDSSHRLNIRYAIWKKGWGDYQEHYSNFLSADHEFRKNLIGRKLEEVEKIFPNLRALSNATRYQRQYSDHIRNRDDFKDSEHFWIGGSQWTIEFKDERVKEVQIWKG